MFGVRRPLEDSQACTLASESLDCSSNLDHHLTLKVLCRISWVRECGSCPLGRLSLKYLMNFKLKQNFWANKIYPVFLMF